VSLIDKILESSRERLAERKAKRPFRELKTRAASARRARYSFFEALQANTFSLIAEVKHRSPSAGNMDSGNVERALDAYVSCPSVAAISILTDTDHFGGSIEDLATARRRTDKPLLRKDFIFDEYQVLEARAFGADAILLMAGLFNDPGRPQVLFNAARDLGMDVLFEIGMSILPIDEQARVIPKDAPIWGINSRQFSSSKLAVRAKAGRLLGTELTTSVTRHRDLFHLIPSGKIAVAESGIESPDDLTQLAGLGYRAALIGTALLKKDGSVETRLRGFDERLRRSNSPVSEVRIPGAAAR
jgi:indole-3-glycerol phosphate synthase